MAGREAFDAERTHAAPRQIEQRRAAHRAKPDHRHVEGCHQLRPN